jgi:hypothetical protein
VDDVMRDLVDERDVAAEAAKNDAVDIAPIVADQGSQCVERRRQLLARGNRHSRMMPHVGRFGEHGGWRAAPLKRSAGKKAAGKRLSR